MRSVFIACMLFGCDQAGVVDAPAPDRAGQFQSQSVERALDSAGEVVETRGFVDAGHAWRGFLVEHASDVREIQMRSGTCYVALAAGSAAVRELELSVFDGEGSHVVQDEAHGAAAGLRFCPSQSGTYYIATSAAAGSGLFGVRTYRGPSGLEIRIDDVFRGSAEAGR